MTTTKVRLTYRSNNAKTGPIPVSTSDMRSCAPGCKLKGNGCYAESGPIRHVWAGTDTRGTSWSEFCQKIAALPDGQLWRHNQAGDLPGGLYIDKSALRALTDANKGRQGFTYTHHELNTDNRREIARANAYGLTVNVSADSLAQADEYVNYGVAPVVVILSGDSENTSYTPAGNKVIKCPAVYRENVSCNTCRLCAMPKRGFVIGFPLHGMQQKKAAEVLNLPKPVKFFRSVKKKESNNPVQ